MCIQILYFKATKQHLDTQVDLFHLGLVLCSDGKESACSTGDPGSIPGLRRSPGEGNGYSLQYSCLENSRDRGARQAPWDPEE